jgi:hypothetical protein
MKRILRRIIATNKQVFAPLPNNENPLFRIEGTMQTAAQTLVQRWICVRV